LSTFRKLAINPLILLVDDEVSNRLVLISYLKRFRLSYVEAKNGLEALKIVQESFENHESKFDQVFIMMDSNMPIMNGEESSLKIREFLKERGLNDPIIICVTANEEVMKTFQNNFIYDEICIKPLKFDRFQLILEKYNLIDL